MFILAMAHFVLKNIKKIFFLLFSGPHSVAKCSVSPEGAYRYKVTYIPVETGIYDVYIRWYNQEIDGKACFLLF